MTAASSSSSSSTVNLPEGACALGPPDLMCIRCGTTKALLIETIGPIIPVVPGRVSIEYTCSACGSLYVHGATVQQVATLLTAAPTTPGVLHFGRNFIHCCEPMAEAGDANSRLARPVGNQRGRYPRCRLEPACSHATADFSWMRPDEPSGQCLRLHHDTGHVYSVAGQGKPAGDHAQRGTTVGIDATQALRAQAASSQTKRPAAHPTSTTMGSSSILCFRPDGTPTKIMPQTRHPTKTPAELTVSAQQQHKVKAATDASGDDPGRLIDGTALRTGWTPVLAKADTGHRLIKTTKTQRGEKK